MSVDQAEELYLMQQALDQAKLSKYVKGAFCVGCVIAIPRRGSKSIVISTGFSRELPGNTHAEANALEKANHITPLDVATLLNIPSNETPPSITDLLHTADVYTTMEPCSVRTSGLAPCADALIVAGIQRCLIGAAEPPDFVNCEGAVRLQNAGIEVVWVKGLEGECLKVARGQDDAGDLKLEKDLDARSETSR
jgi:pyrimidine deaminase RibD-like protein